MGSEDVDVVIIGAGPSGSNAAISYKKLNPDLKIALVDKAIFPRDKSCGDAFGPGVISALKRFGNEHILEDEPEVVSTTLFGPKNIGIQNHTKFFQMVLPLSQGQAIHPGISAWPGKKETA